MGNFVFALKLIIRFVLYFVFRNVMEKKRHYLKNKKNSRVYPISNCGEKPSGENATGIIGFA